MQDESFSPNLPQSVESERRVLGVVILNNEAISQAARLKPSDFFFPAHQKIWRGMLALVERGSGIDPITLQEELRRAGELEQVGGPAYIASLFDGVPRFSNIENYVATVKDRAVARQLIAIGSGIVNKALDNETDASDQLAAARRAIEQVDDPMDCSRWLSAGDALEGWRDSYRTRMKTGKRYDGVATGFSDLDEHLGGITKGDIALIAARPGVGKTAFLTAMVERAVKSPHNPDLVVGVFSMELSKDQWMMRWESSLANVPLPRMRKCELSEDDLRRLNASRQEIKALPIFIDDQFALTPNKLRAAMERLRKDHPGCEYLAIVDYIQLVQGEARGYKDKRSEVTEVSHRLKEIAKDYLGCPIIAAASLKRLPEGRKSKEPDLDDLRESGDLESDAATVIMLHRPELDSPNYTTSRNEKVIAKVAKGRFCGGERITLGFDGTCVRFGDYVEPASSGYSWRDEAQD